MTRSFDTPRGELRSIAGKLDTISDWRNDIWVLGCSEPDGDTKLCWKLALRFQAYIDLVSYTVIQ